MNSLFQKILKISGNMKRVSSLQVSGDEELEAEYSR
jgi:hypothetical protein